MAYVILVFIFNFTNIIFASRILCVSIFPSYSHQTVFNPIWRELSKRGHEVVSITPNPIKDPSLENLTEIDISFVYKIWKDERHKWFQKNENSSAQYMIKNDYKIFGLITERVLEHQNVQELFKQNFDLQIGEWVYPAIFGFSKKFNCPLITVGSIDMTDTISNDIGNPINPVVYSNLFLPYTNSHMTFIQRLQSIEYSFWLRFLYEFYVYPESNKIMNKYFGFKASSIKEIMKNASIHLVNRNSIFYSPHLSMPNVIEFSGIHIKKQPEELNKEVKKFLDNAPNGVIYFSLGTNIKLNSLSARFKSVIFATFKQMPYRILLSFDGSNMTKFPENVKAFKWVSQEDVLGHKNTKVFITQGGLQSTEEAIRKRVPMIGIPFVIDQPRNVFKMVELGIGKYIDYKQITVESFAEAIIEVAENITYKKNIERVAEILEDEPIPSIEKIVYWVEYVLKHNGAKHLRSPYLDIPWYQICWLDIISFVFIILYLCYFILRNIYHVIKKYFIKIKIE